jgi:hypothetical protein
MKGKWTRYRIRYALWHFVKDGQQKALCGVSRSAPPPFLQRSLPADLSAVCSRCRYIYNGKSWQERRVDDPV